MRANSVRLYGRKTAETCPHAAVGLASNSASRKTPESHGFQSSVSCTTRGLSGSCSSPCPEYCFRSASSRSELRNRRGKRMNCRDDTQGRQHRICLYTCNCIEEYFANRRMQETRLRDPAVFVCMGARVRRLVHSRGRCFSAAAQADSFSELNSTLSSMNSDSRTQQGTQSSSAEPWRSNAVCRPTPRWRSAPPPTRRTPPPETRPGARSCLAGHAGTAAPSAPG